MYVVRKYQKQPHKADRNLDMLSVELSDDLKAGAVTNITNQQF